MLASGLRFSATRLVEALECADMSALWHQGGDMSPHSKDNLARIASPTGGRYGCSSVLIVAATIGLLHTCLQADCN